MIFIKSRLKFVLRKCPELGIDMSSTRRRLESFNLTGNTLVLYIDSDFEHLFNLMITCH